MDKKGTVKTIGIVAVIGFVGTIFGILSDSTTFFDWMVDNVSKTNETIGVPKTSQILSEIQETTYMTESISSTTTVMESTTIEHEEINLCDLKVVENSGLWDAPNNAVDTLGNEYLGNILTIGSGYSSDDYIIYYLGGQYTNLTGTIAIDDRSSNSDSYNAQLFVSCDDTVVYDTDMLGRATVPIEFSINIENCQWLKISKAGRGFNGNTTTFILYNWVLGK